MKFTLDETNTIILALEEHINTHYSNDNVSDNNFEKRHKRWFADEIEALIKRLKKSAKLKEIYQRAVMKDRYNFFKNASGDDVV